MTYKSNHGERGYLALLTHILEHGTLKDDRTGVGTRSIFGAQLHFDLQEGFPALTTKRVFLKGVFSELAWLISGSTNVFPMLKEGVTIWNEWADDSGELGPVYGKQWRNWETPAGAFDFGSYRVIDQLQNALDMIKDEPNSRRIVVTAWNPGDVPRQALPPCHMMFQFEVNQGELSCHMYMRSADAFLGVPFNIASYAALTHLMAHLTGLDVGHLIVSFGDVHIYNNHVEQVRLQLTRVIRPMPKLSISDNVTGLSVLTEDFIVEGYDPHPTIKAEVAV